MGKYRDLNLAVGEITFTVTSIYPNLKKRFYTQRVANTSKKNSESTVNIGEGRLILIDKSVTVTSNLTESFMRLFYHRDAYKLLFKSDFTVNFGEGRTSDKVSQIRVGCKKGVLILPIPTICMSESIFISVL